MSEKDASAPHLSIVRGNPTPEEVAVVVTVLSRRGSAAPEPPTFSLWARKSRMTRPTQRPGYGAWRASTMPR
jgi:hypothetical protein